MLDSNGCVEGIRRVQAYRATDDVLLTDREEANKHQELLNRRSIVDWVQKYYRSDMNCQEISELLFNHRHELTPKVREECK